MCNIGAYRSVYLKRFHCVYFGPGGGCQHTGNGELSVLKSSCSTQIFWLKTRRTCAVMFPAQLAISQVVSMLYFDEICNKLVVTFLAMQL